MHKNKLQTKVDVIEFWMGRNYPPLHYVAREFGFSQEYVAVIIGQYLGVGKGEVVVKLSKVC